MVEPTNRADKPKAAAQPGTIPRQVGTGFPVEPLPNVAKVLKEVRKYGTEFTVAGFAQHLGHKTDNSGPFKARLAAYRDWGVISRNGDRVQLTDLGKRIAYPVTPEDERAAMREAFLKYPIFARLYEQSVKGEALETDALGRLAVHNHGISVGSQDKFVTSLVESAVAASLAERMDKTKLRFLADPVATEAAEAPLSEETGGRITSQPPSPRIAPAVLHQAWPVEGGEVLFEVRLDRPLPAAVFAKLAEVVSAADGLAALLGPRQEHDGAAE